MRYEKPQPNNPHKLTINQHRIPARSIERFASADGTVDILFGRKRLALKPRDEFFVAKRAWDQRAEVGYMKSVEDAYQVVAERVAADPEAAIPDKDHETITNYYWLWYHRSRIDSSAFVNPPLKGVTGGSFTKDEEEKLEKAHVGFIRRDGTIPARNIIGLRLQRDIDSGCIADRGKKWGVVMPVAGEFLHPDIPNHGFVPLAPNIGFVLNSQSGLITRANLMDINRKVTMSASRYIFAHDLARAIERLSSV